MTSIPRIAIYRPDSEHESNIFDLFKKHDYSLRVVSNHNEVVELIKEETQDFDAVVIPLQLADQSSGIGACLQLKATQDLVHLPVLALCASSEIAVLQAFYGAGADVVVSLPISSDELFLQVSSLARLHRNFKEQLNKRTYDVGLIHPVIKAFNSIREGFLLFNPQGILMFVNHAAQTMLGLSSQQSELEYQFVAKQLSVLLKEHDSALKLQEDIFEAPTGNCEITLNRLDKQNFRASLTITSILTENNHLEGFSVAIADLGEIQHLGNTLLQAQRTRSLCLTMAAACLRLLEEKQQAQVLAPYKSVENYLELSPKYCSLDNALTALLETLDLVVNPLVVIRVRVTKNLILAISDADFFILMGHMVLHAVEHAGTHGQISINTSDNIPGQGVAITVSSEARKATPFVLKDHIAQLIRSDFENVSSISELSDNFSIGLYVAQSIAERYRTSIEYQDTEDTIIRMRIFLPLSSGGNPKSNNQPPDQ